MRTFVKSILILLFLIITLSVAAMAFVGYLNKPISMGNTEDIVFYIERGSTLNKIAKNLNELGVLKYSWAINAYSRIVGSESDFKIGAYSINKGMTLIEIHDHLVGGRQQLYKITIPEGWTSRQIAEYLEIEQITSAADFLTAVNSNKLSAELGLNVSSLEGFLYPDTYLFQKNYPNEKILKVMVENFFSKLNQIYPDYLELDSSELLNKIILASIVEREYRDPLEAPMMAGVFYNRLSQKDFFPLGSCATIVYIIADIQKKPHPEVITYRDLEIESPYNTYINGGLPPGPISNPGQISLKAAFYPVESDYLYFLLKNPESGQHEFTKSLSEHTAAYNIYIKKN
jgi:UPF0755 protein